MLIEACITLGRITNWFDTCVFLSSPKKISLSDVTSYGLKYPGSICNGLRYPGLICYGLKYAESIFYGLNIQDRFVTV